MIRFSSHLFGNGAEVFEEGSKLGVEGMVSKQVAKPYMPGNPGVWVNRRGTCAAQADDAVLLAVTD